MEPISKAALMEMERRDKQDREVEEGLSQLIPLVAIMKDTGNLLNKKLDNSTRNAKKFTKKVDVVEDLQANQNERMDVVIEKVNSEWCIIS